MTDTIIRLKDVTKRTGLSRSSIYEKIRNKEFPKQIKLGNRASGWLRAEVEGWIQDRVDESRNKSVERGSMKDKINAPEGAKNSNSYLNFNIAQIKKNTKLFRALSALSEGRSSCTHLVLFVTTYSSKPQSVVAEKHYVKLVEQLATLRLLFVAALFVLFDSFMYQGMTTSTAPICVTVIELIILLIVARRSGIPELDQLLERVFNSKPLKSDD